MIKFQAHYVFEAEFSNPNRGNEKGIVEGLVGYVRRNTLVPVPAVMSLEELNTQILIPLYRLYDIWCHEESLILGLSLQTLAKSIRIPVHQ